MNTMCKTQAFSIVKSKTKFAVLTILCTHCVKTYFILKSRSLVCYTVSSDNKYVTHFETTCHCVTQWWHRLAVLRIIENRIIVPYHSFKEVKKKCCAFSKCFTHHNTLPKCVSLCCTVPKCERVRHCPSVLHSVKLCQNALHVRTLCQSVSALEKHFAKVWAC